MLLLLVPLRKKSSHRAKHIFKGKTLSSLPVLTDCSGEKSIPTGHLYSTRDLTILLAEFDFEFASVFIKSYSMLLGLVMSTTLTFMKDLYIAYPVLTSKCQILTEEISHSIVANDTVIVIALFLSSMYEIASP